jgi:hypothetical protein
MAIKLTQAEIDAYIQKRQKGVGSSPLRDPLHFSSPLSTKLNVSKWTQSSSRTLSKFLKFQAA